MHVYDYLVGRVSSLFRFRNYSPAEKAYSLIGASRESVREWVHRCSSLFNPSRKLRRMVAVDETVVKVHGLISYVWSAIDLDSSSICV